jgi:phycocyanin-associated rod linker protein
MTSSMTASLLGIEPLNSTAPIELRSPGNAGDVQAVICAAYRQVFGNDHLMLSERLTGAESLLKQGNLSVREFVRALALSDLYRTKFFQGVFQVRAIELNFKHLLGRAPHDQAEICTHLDRYIEQGYEAEINSYIDSAEYQDNFGDMIVPYHRGFSRQNGQTTADFNRMFQLYRGYASSDRSAGSNRSRLGDQLAMNSTTPLRTSQSGGELMGTAGGDRNQLYRIRVSQGASNRTTQIRRSVSEYLVAYEQLNPTMQRLNQRGSRIVSITTA